MKYTIEDRIFTQVVIDGVTAVTDKYAPPVKPGTQIIPELEFAARVERELRTRLEDWLNGAT
jgi:hypothetical protein